MSSPKRSSRPGREKGGRPPLPEEKRRVHRVHLRFTAAELEQVTRSAREFNLPVATYAHRLALKKRLRPGRLQPEELALLGQVNRIGNNLNQMMVAIYTARVPLELGRTVEECRSLLAEIRDLLATREADR